MKVDTDCLGGGELKTVLRHPVLDAAVNTQLHNVFPRTHKAKSSRTQRAIRTLQDNFNDVVNLDATLREPYLLLVQLRLEWNPLYP